MLRAQNCEHRRPGPAEGSFKGLPDGPTPHQVEQQDKKAPQQEPEDSVLTWKAVEAGLAPLPVGIGCKGKWALYLAHPLEEGEVGTRQMSLP